MIEAIVFTLLVSTDLRDRHCVPNTAIACASHAGQYVIMREYQSLPAGEYRVEIPEGLHFPRLEVNTWSDHYRLVRCGQKIADHNGLPVKDNALATLCHEAAHIAGKRH